MTNYKYALGETVYYYNNKHTITGARNDGSHNEYLLDDIRFWREQKDLKSTKEYWKDKYENAKDYQRKDTEQIKKLANDIAKRVNVIQQYRTNYIMCNKEE